MIGGEICQKEEHPMVTAIDEMKRMMVPVRSVDAHVGILRLSRMENFNSMGVVDATLLTTAIVARIRLNPLHPKCPLCIVATKGDKSKKSVIPFCNRLSSVHSFFPQPFAIQSSMINSTTTLIPVLSP